MMQPSPRCTCQDPNPIVSETDITVHLKDGSAIQLPDYCLSCGAILSGVEGRSIRRDDLKRLWLGYRIGQERLKTAPYMIPAWNDPVLGTPPKVDRELFQGWKNMQGGRRRGNLHAFLGLERDRPVSVNQLSGLPRFSYDTRVINHIDSREDGSGDHVTYVPLLPRTLNEPDSVWSTQYDGKEEQLLYLKRYLVGSQMQTHMAVVDLRDEFVRTAYRLSRYPAESYRFGVLLYSACALEP